MSRPGAGCQVNPRSPFRRETQYHHSTPQTRIRSGLHISVRQILAHGRLTSAASVRPWTLAGNPKRPLMQQQRTIMILEAETGGAGDPPCQAPHTWHQYDAASPGQNAGMNAGAEPSSADTPNMLPAVSEWPTAWQIRSVHHARVQRRQPLPHRHGRLFGVALRVAGTCR